tara:strand:+ start:3840 stop:4508 length:669 start_codon:yes stop_codon:yes gene_type:complete
MNSNYKGFLIHARDYKETSSIINIFTSETGIKSLIFKGKYTNKERFRFSIFNEYSFTYNNNYNLPYIAKFELINQYIFDTKYYLLGLYLNELLYKTLREGYDFDKIYMHYKEFLIYISNSSDSQTRLALLFEKMLLQDLGYELSLQENQVLIDNSYYDYDLGEGFKIQSSKHNNYSILGKDLKLFFMNALICEKTISNLRLIIKKVFKQIYPELELLGDKLF